MKFAIGLAAALAASSAALAGASSPLSGSVNTLGGPGVDGREGTQFQISFELDVNSMDAFGDSSNIIGFSNLPATLGPGEFVVITGIGWDVFLEAFAPSFLSEMTLNFSNSNGQFIALTPGILEERSGRGEFTSGGVIKLADVGLSNLPLDGSLVALEFYEAFDDVADQADGRWINDSVITLQYVVVPTPGSAALLGLAGLVSLRRRR